MALDILWVRILRGSGHDQPRTDAPNVYSYYGDDMPPGTYWTSCTVCGSPTYDLGQDTPCPAHQPHDFASQQEYETQKHRQEVAGLAAVVRTRKARTRR